MSMSGPASSRWSRGGRPGAGSPTSRSDRVLVGRRSGRGGWAARASAASRRSSDPRELLGELARARRDRLHRGDLLARVPARGLGRADRLRRRGSARARRASSLGQQRAPALVERQQLVHGLGGRPAAPGRPAPPPGRGGSAGRQGLLLPPVPVAARRRATAAAWPCSPAYLATNSATAAAWAPTTMFWGMIAPEKPPLRIANRTAVRRLVALVEVGALGAQLGAHVVARPLRARPPTGCGSPSSAGRRGTAPDRGCGRGADALGAAGRRAGEHRAATATASGSLGRRRIGRGSYGTMPAPMPRRRAPLALALAALTVPLAGGLAACGEPPATVVHGRVIRLR